MRDLWPEAAHVGAPEPDSALDTPESLTFRRHTDISFPARVRVGEWCNLRVQLVPAEVTMLGGEVREQPRPHPHDATLTLLAPSPSCPVRLTVSVAAENFDIRGPYRVAIVVPREGKSPAVHFDLRGRQVGPGRVMIDFAQEGNPAGSVDLTPEVVLEVDTGAAGRGLGISRMTLDLGLKQEPSPDLVLKVFEHRLAGQPGRLQFVLSSSRPALADLPVFDGDFGTLDLKADVSAWVEAQLQGLSQLAGRTDATAEDVSRARRRGLEDL